MPLRTGPLKKIDFFFFRTGFGLPVQDKKSFCLGEKRLPLLSPFSREGSVAAAALFLPREEEFLFLPLL